MITVVFHLLADFVQTVTVSGVLGEDGCLEVSGLGGVIWGAGHPHNYCGE